MAYYVPLTMFNRSIHPKLNVYFVYSISRKVVGKNVHATIPKGNIRYDQYAVRDTAAVESSIVAFL